MSVTSTSPQYPNAPLRVFFYKETSQASNLSVVIKLSGIWARTHMGISGLRVQNVDHVIMQGPKIHKTSC